MKKKLITTWTLFYSCTTGLILICTLLACNKKEIKNTGEANATSEHNLHAEIKDFYNMKIGELYYNADGSVDCNPEMGCCHFTESNQGPGSGPWDVNLEMVNINTLKVTNINSQTLSQIDVSISYALPASFVTFSGYTSITTQPGTYPIIIDATHPYGYYLLSVTAIP